MDLPNLFSWMFDPCTVEAGEKVAKILAIVLGGGAAYYKFLRGRVFRPRMEVALSAQWLLAEKQQFLKVTAALKNTGASRIPFDLDYSVLEIYGGGHSGRKIADLTAWEKLATLDFTHQHQWIEAAETIEVHWLIDLPAEAQYSVLKSELTVAGKKSFWKSDTIIEREPRVISQPNEKSEDVDGRPRGFFSLVIDFFTSLRRRQ